MSLILGSLLQGTLYTTGETYIVQNISLYTTVEILLFEIIRDW